MTQFGHDTTNRLLEVKDIKFRFPKKSHLIFQFTDKMLFSQFNFFKNYHFEIYFGGYQLSKVDIEQYFVQFFKIILFQTLTFNIFLKFKVEFETFTGLLCP